MYTSIFLSLVLSSTVHAVNITIPNIYGEIGEGPAPFVAARINEDSTATTYSVGCPVSVTTFCPSYWSGYTYKIGASKLEVAMTDHDPSPGGADFTMTASCSILGSTTGTYTAVCAESYGGTEANFPGSSTETQEFTDFLTYSVVATQQAVSGSAQVTKTSSAVAMLPSSTASGTTTPSGTAPITRAPSASSTVAAGTVRSSASAAVSSSTTANSAGMITKSAGMGSVLACVLVVLAVLS